MVQLGRKFHLFYNVMVFKVLFIGVDPYYHEFMSSIDGRHNIQFGRHSLSAVDYLAALENCLYSEVMRSLVWNFARTSTLHMHNEEGRKIREASFYKEFHASQLEFWPWQIRDYSALFGIDPDPPLEAPIKTAARHVVHHLAVRLNQENVWFPAVQRSKNVSYETGLMAEELAHKSYREITTKDLEVIYHRTGIKVQGECEMRSAWKFNDLKPRVYYAQGGRDYFASRYMKQFAVILMDSIPISERNRRTHPEYYLDHDFQNDFVVTWDFESFTTKLSELKHFLYYIARALEEEAVYDIRLFDYREGEISVHPSVMLDDYNETCNMQSPFSIHRLVAKYCYDEDSSHLYHQQNSGMLGVAGNIGFSTSLHAYAILETVGKDRGVCVGDDAKAIVRDPEPIQLAMQELGSIHPEKFSLIPPLDADPYRFLKRGFFRNPDGSFWKSTLYNFPIPAYIDKEFGDRDVFVDHNDPQYFLKRFATTTGALLWQVQQSGQDITDTDLQIILEFLIQAYHIMQLPRRGALPGYIFSFGNLKGQRSCCAIPAICFNEFDPRYGDWLEFLLHEGLQTTFDVPVMSPRCPLTIGDPGDTVYCTSSPLLAVLEDIEVVRVERQIEQKSYLNDWDRDAFRTMIKRGLKMSENRPLVLVEYVNTIPEAFLSSFSYPDPLYSIWEIVAEI